MTRTHVDEVELIELGQDAIEVFSGLDQLAAQLEEYSDQHPSKPIDRAATLAGNLEEIARQLSDKVDALCEYVRHSRMLD